MSVRSAALLAVLVYVLPVRADKPAPPAAPWYVDDEQLLDDFTDRLAELDKAGKCLSSADIAKKTETDHPCKIDLLPPASKPLATDAIFRASRPGVFLIGCVKRPEEAGGEYGDGWFGTAWAAAADGVLVTNWHVFEDADGMAFGAVDHTGKVYPVTDILAVHKRADLAVVKVAGSGFTPLPVAASPPAVGAWVGVLSHPGNQPFTFTQGSVSRYAANFGGLDAFGERWMAVTAEYAGGSSGGPVLDQFGNVVGMACLTSNIDHDGHAMPKDTPSSRRRRKADEPHPPPPAESMIQMVVKLAVPVSPIRRAMSAPLDTNDPAAAPDPDPATQTAALAKRYERSKTRVEKRLAQTGGDEAKGLEDQLHTLKTGYAKGLLRIAQADPADARGVPGLCDSVPLADATDSDKALAILAKHHAKSDKLAGVLYWLADGTSEAGEGLLRAVADANPHRDCKGVAAFALGLHAKRAGREAGKKTDRKAAEKWLTEVAEKYADVKPMGADRPLGVLARKHLAGVANLHRLQFGKEPPDIAGPDLDDKPMSLADHKGKAVLLDFWGYGFPPCEGVAEIEKKLLTELAGQPFAVVGVNADDDPEVLKTGRQDRPLPWRSFRNGDKDKPTIADAWCVGAFPTLVLIGKDGRIRKVWEGVPADGELEAEVRTAVK